MKKKYNEKQSKKIRNLVVICVLCGIVFATSTYAWFIGMKTVNVSSFDIKIATTEGLYLSMDGKNWTYELDVANAPQYENNANQIDGVELIPMSSVGEMDVTASRMKLYEKGSLTATTGGYRLLASRVDNNTTKNAGGIEYNEAAGYVAFDLFVKNLSGEEYYPTNNPLNEEAIYLTTNSIVKVSDGGGTPNTGIENSVRVAFAQIGRVTADLNDQARITSITCANDGINTDENYITGICREAQIWEPNDRSHIQNAINWYNKACYTRKADGITVEDENSYNVGTSCTTISDGTSYPTYAIANEIVVGDNVNVYDGAAYNTYVANTADYDTYLADDDKTDYKLVEYPTFTDEMKERTGTNRPAFMTLAPNSITKIRVYVYLEGQDVDNYDFAQLGKQITVNFGFTKERFTEDDVTHEGPSTDITERVLYYEAEGTIDAISNPEITWNAETNQFTIPVTVKETFTFTDNGVLKTATFAENNSELNSDDTWTIA